jgi:hypothetical protein
VMEIPSVGHKSTPIFFISFKKVFLKLSIDVIHYVVTSISKYMSVVVGAWVQCCQKRLSWLPFWQAG